jgi:hypothetical protein
MKEGDDMETVTILMGKADELFMDCKINGFDKEKASAYNILCSSLSYLKTGDPLIGNRTLKFFEV